MGSRSPNLTLNPSSNEEVAELSILRPNVPLLLSQLLTSQHE